MRDVAERKGFSQRDALAEPSIRLHVYTLSRRAPSTRESFGQPLGHLSIFVLFQPHLSTRYTLCKHPLTQRTSDKRSDASQQLNNTLLL